MDKPPGANVKQKEAIKSEFKPRNISSVQAMYRHIFIYFCILFLIIHSEQNEQMEKAQAKHKCELNSFRKFAEERLERFRRDEKRKSMQFQTLDKVLRTIV